MCMLINTDCIDRREKSLQKFVTGRFYIKIFFLFLFSLSLSLFCENGEKASFLSNILRPYGMRNYETQNAPPIAFMFSNHTTLYAATGCVGQVESVTGLCLYARGCRTSVKVISICVKEDDKYTSLW